MEDQGVHWFLIMLGIRVFRVYFDSSRSIYQSKIHEGLKLSAKLSQGLELVLVPVAQLSLQAHSNCDTTEGDRDTTWWVVQICKKINMLQTLSICATLFDSMQAERF